MNDDQTTTNLYKIVSNYIFRRCLLQEYQQYRVHEHPIYPDVRNSARDNDIYTIPLIEEGLLVSKLRSNAEGAGNNCFPNISETLSKAGADYITSAYVSILPPSSTTRLNKISHPLKIYCVNILTPPMRVSGVWIENSDVGTGNKVDGGCSIVGVVTPKDGGYAYYNNSDFRDRVALIIIIDTEKEKTSSCIKTFNACVPQISKFKIHSSRISKSDVNSQSKFTIDGEEDKEGEEEIILPQCF